MISFSSGFAFFTGCFFGSGFTSSGNSSSVSSELSRFLFDNRIIDSATISVLYRFFSSSHSHDLVFKYHSIYTFFPFSV